MGWWAVDVFGGDEPLDVLDAAARILSVPGGGECLPTPDEWDDTLAGQVRDALAAMGGLEQLALAIDWREKHTVATQALVAIAIGAGAELDDSWRQRGIDAAGNDKWAARDGDRDAVMREFAEMIRDYVTGDRQAMHHRGLFDYVEQQP